MSYYIQMRRSCRGTRCFSDIEVSEKVTHALSGYHAVHSMQTVYDSQFTSILTSDAIFFLS
jgi:hypothetical protein